MAKTKQTARKTPTRHPLAMVPHFPSEAPEKKKRNKRKPKLEYISVDTVGFLNQLGSVVSSNDSDSDTDDDFLSGGSGSSSASNFVVASAAEPSPHHPPSSKKSMSKRKHSGGSGAPIKMGAPGTGDVTNFFSATKARSPSAVAHAVKASTPPFQRPKVTSEEKARRAEAAMIMGSHAPPMPFKVPQKIPVHKSPQRPPAAFPTVPTAVHPGMGPFAPPKKQPAGSRDIIPGGFPPGGFRIPAPVKVLKKGLALNPAQLEAARQKAQQQAQAREISRVVPLVQRPFPQLFDKKPMAPPKQSPHKASSSPEMMRAPRPPGAVRKLMPAPASISKPSGGSSEPPKKSAPVEPMEEDDDDDEEDDDDDMDMSSYDGANKYNDKGEPMMSAPSFSLGAFNFSQFEVAKPDPGQQGAFRSEWDVARVTDGGEMLVEDILKIGKNNVAAYQQETIEEEEEVTEDSFWKGGNSTTRRVYVPHHTKAPQTVQSNADESTDESGSSDEEDSAKEAAIVRALGADPRELTRKPGLKVGQKEIVRGQLPAPKKNSGVENWAGPSDKGLSVLTEGGRLVRGGRQLDAMKKDLEEGVSVMRQAGYSSGVASMRNEALDKALMLKPQPSVIGATPSNSNRLAIPRIKAMRTRVSCAGIASSKGGGCSVHGYFGVVYKPKGTVDAEMRRDPPSAASPVVLAATHDMFLGAGSFGVSFVFKGELACKVIIPAGTRSYKNIVAEIVSEAKWGLTLDHPHIVRCVKAFLLNSSESKIPLGVIFSELATTDMGEFFENDSWSEPKNVPVRKTLVRRFEFHSLQALAYLHSKGIAHRDIKNENIFIHRDVSLGHVAKLGDLASCATGVTTSLVGSIMYIAPETAAARIQGAEGDMWAWAVTMFQAHSNRRPFHNTEAAIRDAPSGYKRVFGYLGGFSNDSFNQMAIDNGYMEKPSPGNDGQCKHRTEPNYGDLFMTREGELGLPDGFKDICMGIFRTNPAERLTAAAVLAKPRYTKEICLKHSPPMSSAPENVSVAGYPHKCREVFTRWEGEMLPVKNSMAAKTVWGENERSHRSMSPHEVFFPKGKAPPTMFEAQEVELGHHCMTGIGSSFTRYVPRELHGSGMMVIQEDIVIPFGESHVPLVEMITNVIENIWAVRSNWIVPIYTYDISVVGNVLSLVYTTVNSIPCCDSKQTEMRTGATTSRIMGDGQMSKNFFAFEKLLKQLLLMIRDFNSKGLELDPGMLIRECLFYDPSEALRINLLTTLIHRYPLPKVTTPQFFMKPGYLDTPGSVQAGKLQKGQRAQLNERHILNAIHSLVQRYGFKTAGVDLDMIMILSATAESLLSLTDLVRVPVPEERSIPSPSVNLSHYKFIPSRAKMDPLIKKGSMPGMFK
nr:protein kinase [Salmonid herpesvirus 1]